MIISSKAIIFLNKELKLITKGDEQDWDLELADSGRIEEFILFYKSTLLDDNEKIALMALILASYDDYLNNRSHSIVIWNLICEILKPDKLIFGELIKYWSLENITDENDHFNITPYIREITSPFSDLN
jgi:hypothetical protein